VIVAVTSTVVFEIPDGKIEDAKQKFYEAHLKVLGVPMETITGQPWVLKKIERFEIARRDVS
jgi:hypothetical protein